jgi:hypothetical protein
MAIPQGTSATRQTSGQLALHPPELSVPPRRREWRPAWALSHAGIGPRPRRHGLGIEPRGDAIKTETLRPQRLDALQRRRFALIIPERLPALAAALLGSLRLLIAKISTGSTFSTCLFARLTG